MNVISLPQKSLERLTSGNLRFTQGLISISNFVTEEKLRNLVANGQRPFATILTCSDSRLPAELLFDQGFGDLFVVRVAGNVVAPSLIASMEFAATALGSPLILVMGHTNCGAVKAASDYVAHPNMKLTENLRDLVSRITPAIHQTLAKDTFKKVDENFLLDATKNNVLHSMKMILEQSETLREMAKSGTIEVHGSVCDLNTAKVSFLGAAEAFEVHDYVPAISETFLSQASH